MDENGTRRGQRTAVVASWAVVVIAVTVVAAAAITGGHSSTPVRAAGVPIATTTSTSVESTTSTAATAPASVPEEPTRTAPVVTTAPTEPVSTTPPTPPACEPSDLRVAGSTDRHSYEPGDPVVLTFTVKNVSARTCREDYGRFSIQVADGYGLHGEKHNGFFEYTSITPPASILDPNASSSSSYTWNQDLQCGDNCVEKASPDTYLVFSSWSTLGVAEVAVTIKPPPS